MLRRKNNADGRGDVDHAVGLEGEFSRFPVDPVD